MTCTGRSFNLTLVLKALLELVKTWISFKLLFALVYLSHASFIFVVQAACYFILVKPWNPRLYRKLNYYFTMTLHSQLTFLIDWWCNAEREFFMNPNDLQFLGKEHALIVANHGKDLEAFLPWSFSLSFNMLGNFRGMIKKMLGYFPLYGWCWVLQEQVLVERNWERDQKRLNKQIRVLLEYPRPVWLMIFAEGTRFTEAKRELSMKVAKEKGLPELKHLLLPRTKGFLEAVNHMRGRAPALYDFTTVVDKRYEGNATFSGLLQGKKLAFQIAVQRFRMDELPEDEKGLVMWLHKRFQEKDKLIENFMKTGEFMPDCSSVSTEEMKTDYKDHEYLEFPKHRYSLFSIVFWAAIILGILFHCLLSVLMNGDYLKLGFIAVSICAASFGFDKVIDLSVTGKGSSYGQSGKEK